MNEKKIGIFSIISLITGVLAIIFAVMIIAGAPFFISLILGGVSIITGILAFIFKNKIAMPIIGISISAIAIVVAIILSIISPVLEEVKDEVKGINNSVSNIQAKNSGKADATDVINDINGNTSNKIKYNTVNNTANKNTSTTNNANTSNITNTTNSTNTASTSSSSQNTQRVGSDEFGYISVPSNWTKFIDPDAPNTIQYSYANVYIATLYAADTTQVSAENYAQSTASLMQQDGVTGVTGATVKIGKYTAYQVYGHYDADNTWLVCWHFEAEDGKTHYIAIEGPDASSDYFKIPETFSLNK